MTSKKLDHFYISVPVYEKYGGDIAILLAFFALPHKTAYRDKNGYFALSTNFICDMLGLKERVFRKRRAVLIEGGYLAYKPGKNQNQKPRYKVLKQK